MLLERTTFSTEIIALPPASPRLPPASSASPAPPDLSPTSIHFLTSLKPPQNGQCGVSSLKPFADLKHDGWNQ
ncbi:MAG: hypothetical protein IIB54_14940 [Planctomycetes bacterium]|nr:hypothetical protein [Planctomycetota bacterium]